MSFFIDVQGTLLSDADKSPVNGACKLIEFLNKKNLPYIVITNNTKHTSAEFLASLRQKGLAVKDGAYLDPFCVLDDIIKPCEVAMFGADEFINTMQKLGYTQNLKNAKAVMVASFDDFKFSDFASMIELINDGAKFIPMHETSVYKKHGRLFPGVGAIASMIKNATGTEYKAVGKPSVKFFQTALNLIKKQDNSLNFKDIKIISDDARGDLSGAKNLGMQTVLVLSGKVSSVQNSGVKPEILDEIYKDVGEFLEVLSAKYK